MKKLLFCLFYLAAAGGACAAEPGAKAKTAAKVPAAAHMPASALPAGDQPTVRAKRQADIDYWLKTYDGSEFISGEYRCPPPRFPSVSKDNAEIDRVSANMEVWQACYNNAVKHFNGMPSLINLVPTDIVTLLAPDEKKQMEERMQLVRSNVNETMKVSADLVLADFSAWRSATNAWVNAHNEIVKNAPTPEREHQLDERRQNRVN